MTQTTETSVAGDVEAQPLPRISQASTVIKLLSRNRGATVAEMMGVTHWQPHSTRAFLTGLRKKGRIVLKESRKDGETSYRLER